LKTIVAVVLAMAMAFALRTIPAYDHVFAVDGVQFQEPDAWYHMRTVHNLLAHFPSRSGFDPYALFPGGEDVPTGPVWDLTIATTAKIAGFGSPSEATVDRVGAWLPAAIGALIPLVAFWLARTLSESAAGCFAAWWAAFIPGAYLWVTHLGLSDHHAAESLFAMLTVACLCAAVDRFEQARARQGAWLTLAAGLSLGALLGTRPAAAFVVAIFAIAALLRPDRWPAVAGLGMTGVAAICFLATGRLQWSDYAWLTLAGAGAAFSGVLLVETLWRKTTWPRIYLTIAILSAGAVAAGVIFVARPALWHRLLAILRHFAGGETETTVRELRPLLSYPDSTPVAALFKQLGTAWIVAIPALAWIAVLVVRKKRPALTLFFVWSVMMGAGAFVENRMLAYFGPVLAVLCGIFCGKLVDWSPLRLRPAATVLLAAAIAASNWTLAVGQASLVVAPSKDWRAAMKWLRDNTPEPMGDAAAYFRQYERRDGRVFDYPSSAYAVEVWWDYGYWLLNLARRMPSSNGTQAGADATADFYLAGDPATGAEKLRASRARYVVADRSLTLADLNAGGSIYGAVVSWTGRVPTQYARLLYRDDSAGYQGVLVYLPDYYRTMSVRLFSFDGRRVASNESWVIATRDEQVTGGNHIDVIKWTRRFGSEREARGFIAAHPEQRVTLGGFDTASSCVDLDESAGFTPMFRSDTVKIFEAPHQ
jgi:oligosaccharyl transferase (archaeosortase A-associated)